MNAVFTCVVGFTLRAACTPKVACRAITHVLQSMYFVLTMCRAGDVVGQQPHMATLRRWAAASAGSGHWPSPPGEGAEVRGEETSFWHVGILLSLPLPCLSELLLRLKHGMTLTTM